MAARRRLPHHFRTSRRDALSATCVHCGLERKKLITIAHGEPVWTSACVELFRPEGAKHWTTNSPACFQNVELRAPR